VAAYGVDVGSANPAWNTEVDLFQYDDTFSDFEQAWVATP
jgi:hypothetical protein